MVPPLWLLVVEGAVTAEIAILNSSAVVLAADSALTVKSNGGVMYYHGVNKIFGLSAAHNVAIMVHGNLSFCGITWEVIIRSYRDFLALSDVPPPSNLRDYVEQFLDFLDSFIERYGVVPALIDCYNSYCVNLSNYLRKIFLAQLKAANADPERSAEYHGKVVPIINDTLDGLDKRSDNVSGDAAGICYREQELDKHSSLASNSIISVYPYLEYEPDILRKVERVYSRMFARGAAFNGESGIVFAGYGADEILPRVIGHSVIGFAFGKAAVIREQVSCIDSVCNAAIVPFGRLDMINTFIHGISPDFRDSFVKASKTKLKTGVKINEFFQNIANEIQKSWEARLVSALTLLPKHALAEIADNLVRLSAIGGNVHNGDGGTGGPVSVAIISKGEGLIWIKRHHYFDQALNPHYMSRTAIASQGRPLVGG